MLALGHLIDQRYEVLGPLGAGGMGAVYRVRHVHLAREFALKELTSGGAGAEVRWYWLFVTGPQAIYPRALKWSCGSPWKSQALSLSFTSPTRRRYHY